MKRRELTTEEIKEGIEHRDALLHIRQILSTPSGQFFFKYLFRQLGVLDLPELGLEGPILYDTLGYLRSGRSIFKLASEANPTLAAGLLSEIEKERYEQVYAENGREERI